MAKKKKILYEQYIPAILVVWVVLMGLVIFTRPGVSGHTPPVKWAVPTPTLSQERFTSFSGEGFSFQYPGSLQIQFTNSETTSWKATHTNNTFTFNSLVLSRQPNPFSPLAVGGALALSTGKTQPTPVTVTIQSIDEEKEILIDGITATRYTISCGVDCYYHLVRFPLNGYYYELRADGAGGGLLTRFEQILSSMDVE